MGKHNFGFQISETTPPHPTSLSIVKASESRFTTGRLNDPAADGYLPVRFSFFFLPEHLPVSSSLITRTRKADLMAAFFSILPALMGSRPSQRRP